MLRAQGYPTFRFQALRRRRSSHPTSHGTFSPEIASDRYRHSQPKYVRPRHYDLTTIRTELDLDKEDLFVITIRK